MRRFALLALLLTLPVIPGCIYAPFDLGLDAIGQVVEARVVDGPSDAKTLLIRIDGEITDHPGPSGILGSQPGMVARVRQELDLARRDEDLKAVIVRIDSPGGGVTASDLLFHELDTFRRETGLPIVAFFLDTAASGGYYLAQAADVIVACPTTITGSIGVIAQFPNVAALADKVGVRMETIKSGANKDLGNLFRPMRDDERAIFQSLIDQMYERFVKIVHHGRRARAGHEAMTLKAVREAADGRVFTAKEAKEIGLIDEIGYFEKAHEIVDKLAGITGRSRVITYERKAIGGSKPTIYSRQSETGGISLTARTPGGGEAALGRAIDTLLPRSGATFKYLWSPSAP